MKKEIEDYLWEKITRSESNTDGVTAREAINEMVETGIIQSPKQGWSTLEKWQRKGMWGVGSNLEMGWKIDLTNK